MFVVIMCWFYNFCNSVLFGVLFFVFMMMVFLLSNNFNHYNFSYVLWTEYLCMLIPFFILLVILYPSLFLLYYYSLDNNDFDLTIKVIGHQWYWGYLISDLEDFFFDSYMKSLDYLTFGDSLYLDVDNRLILPVNFLVRFCVTSMDVIHSWSLNNFFIKMDAISGIMNVFSYFFSSVGVFYGQCSEICGANHSFMPIVIEISLFNLFKHWCLIS